MRCKKKKNLLKVHLYLAPTPWRIMYTKFSDPRLIRTVLFTISHESTTLTLRNSRNLPLSMENMFRGYIILVLLVIFLFSPQGADRRTDTQQTDTQKHCSIHPVYNDWMYALSSIILALLIHFIFCFVLTKVLIWILLCNDIWPWKTVGLILSLIIWNMCTKFDDPSLIGSVSIWPTWCRETEKCTVPCIP